MLRPWKSSRETRWFSSPELRSWYWRRRHVLSAAEPYPRLEFRCARHQSGVARFLTEVPLENLYATLQSISKTAATGHRSMVHCEVYRKDTCVGSYDALNDIVVGKGTIARLNHCDVYITRYSFRATRPTFDRVHSHGLDRVFVWRRAVLS